jgi:hypothetical protein
MSHLDSVYNTLQVAYQQYKNEVANKNNVYHVLVKGNKLDTLYREYANLFPFQCKCRVKKKRHKRFIIATGEQQISLINRRALKLMKNLDAPRVRYYSNIRIKDDLHFLSMALHLMCQGKFGSYHYECQPFTISKLEKKRLLKRAITEYNLQHQIDSYIKTHDKFSLARHLSCKIYK